jgi:pimeloyl-ACP methyl ester carboxylesterase
MHTELVSIPTDTIPLDGAYYEPDGRAAGAVLLFHGNTMNFYVGAPRFLPPVLTRLGLACLAFNRRGARHSHHARQPCRARRRVSIHGRGNRR